MESEGRFDFDKLSILEAQLIDEYFRCLRSLNIHRRAAALPECRGYISEKSIKGKKYYYRQWREGERIVSEYLHKEDVENVSKQIERRKSHQCSIKALEKSIRQIEKAIGKELINEYRHAFQEGV